MKTLQKIALFIALVALFASCQPSTDVNKILSNPDTKKAIIDKIATDSNLSKEMMESMMNSEISKTMMMGNEKMILMMMKENPTMMQSMMSGMMETCKNDTAMMSIMCKSIMKNPQMMKMMHMKGMKDME